ncbi:asparagine synthase, glutamine-hydrolyzing [Desulfocapsa sulfexigens DSM 10523]|uniref:asparagine synthase (glutamine-hydrolyzing) n=1 Tax=Desulfocapsa sulfexigens (strain DSM 10523 / SB164P1) TaxID=1167006 RepID=M1NFB0_DESSD|nr:asparagine synthase (glutamine-hydrolyzing) [Desulfocapsa sulfexigens]AGF78359.1 asparagine synthase, glutamine-hydrolyzing [Desulfocapsa sulfexigens DSM 10523]
MCGILGIYNLNGAPCSPAVLKRMTISQQHRGPDDSGIRMFSLTHQTSCEMSPKKTEKKKNGSFEGGLGFNRLSILDLSSDGHQPMCNHDGSIFIAFNGEIYNAFDYQKELSAAGYTFRSKTDTEVVLYLYEHIGFEAMLDRLNGMFAICIVDLNKREIFLARDHFGIKPLYWVKQGNTVLFSSEVKSFLEHPDFRAELDRSHVDEYLTFRYCADEDFLLKNVKQLQPGYFLRISSNGITKKQYWEIGTKNYDISLDETAILNKLDQLLGESVERQLISDVKLGCQLSGGIDSSLVTAYARRNFGADLETFSIVFQDNEFSEDKWISQAAAKCNVHSHRYMMGVSDIITSFDKATWHLDQPLNLPNSLGIYLLAEKSKDIVTVLLSGEGADELFGGYSRYYDVALRSRFTPLLPGLQLIPGLGGRLARKFNTSLSPEDAFILASATLSFDDLKKLRPEMDWNKTLGKRQNLLGRFDSGRIIKQCLKYDMQTYMVDLLVRQDKMTMAHSMENRVPFLDRKLVDFVYSLPVDYLVGDSLQFKNGYSKNTKKILKKLAEQTFDNNFAYRTKCGFPLPLEEFFKTQYFTDYMEQCILPGIKNRGVFQETTVRNWWTQLKMSGQKNGRKIWIAVAFEIWAQIFLDTSNNSYRGL